MYLHIAVESFWRGSMLDTVKPLATLPMQSNKDLPGSRTTGGPFSFSLMNGESVEVTCATNPSNRYFLNVRSLSGPILEVAADAPIYLQARLADGKLYVFTVRPEA